MSSVDQGGMHRLTPVDSLAVPPAEAPTVLAAAPLVSTLMLDLLAWVASRPRTYAEAMEAWRTSCPRFPIWEDALDAGLVQVDRQSGKPMGETRVSLTAPGRAILDGL